MTEPSGKPGDANYNPHYDPAVSGPEIPVPGLGTWPDDYIPANPGNADGHIDYPDDDAPVSPGQQRKNAGDWVLYQTTIWCNGVLTYTIGGDDVAGLRDVVRAFLLGPPWGRDAGVFVQIRTLDTFHQQWLDLSGGTPPAGWDGMVNVEVRVNAGWGDKL